MLKTNAIRILEQHKIKYEELSYERDGKFISGLETIQKLNLDPTKVFKTIVCHNQNKYFVLLVPVMLEINLKKAAKSLEQKSLELVATKDLLNLTGYERGGCSPIGMKKQWPTYIDVSAKLYDYIYISAGKLGYQIKLNPNDLASLVKAKFIDLVD